MEGEERYALLAGYHEEDRRVLRVGALCQRLRTAAYGYPKDQVLVFDTCATVFDAYEYRQELSWDTLGPGQAERDCAQFVMFASEDRGVAQNRPGVGGVFTGELLDVLGGSDPAELADVGAIHDRVLRRFDGLRRGDPKAQRPVRYYWKPPQGGGEDRDLVPEHLTAAEEFVFELERDGDRLRITGPAGETREVDPPWRLSFTHISLLTEVLTVINLAAIFHNTVHLFKLSTEPNENTISG